jgi:hypothetical protein
VRDRWQAEYKGVLAGVIRSVEERTGERPKLTLDQRKLALDIVVPKFTLPARLEHFRPGQQTVRGREVTKAIGEVWEQTRAAHPELWTYEAWYAANMARTNTRELTHEDFAERMRRKRDGKFQNTEAPEAPGEEAE